jgi:hypothetical protein
MNIGRRFRGTTSRLAHLFQRRRKKKPKSCSPVGRAGVLLLALLVAAPAARAAGTVLLAPYPLTGKSVKEGSGELFTAIEVPQLTSGWIEPDMVRLRGGWRGTLFESTLGGVRAGASLGLGMVKTGGGALPRPDQQLRFTLDRSFGEVNTGVELRAGEIGHFALSKTQDRSRTLQLHTEYALGYFGKVDHQLVLRYTFSDFESAQQSRRIEAAYELKEGRSNAIFTLSHDDDGDNRAEFKVKLKY